MSDFEAELERLNGYPSGDADAWIRRYAPLVASVLEHHAPAAPKVSIVLVAWNTPRQTVECLDSLLRQRIPRHDFEIILIDNGGLERARVSFPSRVDREIRMIDNARLCRVRNLGVAWARAPIVCFIDDDGIVERDYLERALRYFEDDDVLAIRSRIIAREHPYFTSLADHYSRGSASVDDCLVTEGSSLVRRDNYIRARGFAEALAGHEGIDLTFRLLRDTPSGRVLYAPDVVMRHDYMDGWTKFWRKSWSYAGIDHRIAQRSQELSAFMDQYHARRYDRAELTLPQAVARRTLGWLRRRLERGAQLAHRFKR